MTDDSSTSGGQREDASGQTNSAFDAAMTLAVELSSDRWFRYNAEITIDELIASLRICDHLRQGQPTAVAVRVFALEERILESIANWAFRRRVTSEQLRDLKQRLDQCYRTESYDPQESLVVDHLLVRDVLTGKTMPLLFGQASVPWPEYLAFLANELPWERARALRALDAITLKNVSDVQQIQEYLNGLAHFSWKVSTWQRWLRPESQYGANRPAAWEAQRFLASTSYLTRLEYRGRVPISAFYRQLVEVEMRRRALLIQIALLLYRRDHDRYPVSLSQLTPDYLEELPLDPYSGKPFRYASSGLELPLRTLPYTKSSSLSPHTPIVWSVGPNDARLTRRESTSSKIDADPNVKPIEFRTEYYVLSGGDIYWDNEPGLIFSLPK